MQPDHFRDGASGWWLTCRLLVIVVAVLVLGPTRVLSQDSTAPPPPTQQQVESFLADNAVGGTLLNSSTSALLASAIETIMSAPGVDMTLDDVQMLYHTVNESARIPHQYTVKLKPAVDAQLAERIWQLLDLIGGIQITDRFRRIFTGCVIEVPGELPLDLLRQIPWIEYILESSVWTIAQVQTITGSNGNWGLDRIDQPALPMDRSYTFSLTGKGANVYMIDTGVDVNHVEFQDQFGQPRARTFYVSRELDGAPICNEHGTHVAGVVGGLNVGVAKEANLFSLRVIGCDDNAGNTAITTAIEFIIDNHESPAIINMSLGPLAGSGLDPSIDSAVASAIAAGITVVVAAGNGIYVPGAKSNVGVGACDTSPAGSPGAITVGATTIYDYRAPFSNYGPCLALFAPGVDIVSARNGTRDQYLLKSGTSQAAPFVSGVAALQLQRDPSTTPAEMMQALRAAASPNVVRDARGSPNYLLQSVYTPTKGSDDANRAIVALTIYQKTGLTTLQMVGCALAGFAVIVIVGVSIYVWRRRRARRRAMAVGSSPRQQQQRLQSGRSPMRPAMHIRHNMV